MFCSLCLRLRGRPRVLAAAVGMLAVVACSQAANAFYYPPIADPITGATLRIDVAEL